MSDWSQYVQQWLQGQQVNQPTAVGGVNRSGPAIPPQIPIPQNQNQNPGGYMQQAFNLSGVPQPPSPMLGGRRPGYDPVKMLGGRQPGYDPVKIPPQYQQYIAALLGNQQQGSQPGYDPVKMQILQSLAGR